MSCEAVAPSRLPSASTISKMFASTTYAVMVATSRSLIGRSRLTYAASFASSLSAARRSSPIRLARATAA